MLKTFARKCVPINFLLLLAMSLLAGSFALADTEKIIICSTQYRTSQTDQMNEVISNLVGLANGGQGAYETVNVNFSTSDLSNGILRNLDGNTSLAMSLKYNPAYTDPTDPGYDSQGSVIVDFHQKLFQMGYAPIPNAAIKIFEISTKGGFLGLGGGKFLGWFAEVQSTPNSSENVYMLQLNGLSDLVICQGAQ